MTFRNAINTLFPEEVAIRGQELENDPEFEPIMERFEVFGERVNYKQEKAAANDDTLNFYKICIFLLLVILLLIVSIHLDNNVKIIICTVDDKCRDA